MTSDDLRGGDKVNPCPSELFSLSARGECFVRILRTRHCRSVRGVKEAAANGYVRRRGHAKRVLAQRTKGTAWGGRSDAKDGMRSGGRKAKAELAVDMRSEGVFNSSSRSLASCRAPCVWGRTLQGRAGVTVSPSAGTLRREPNALLGFCQYSTMQASW